MPRLLLSSLLLIVFCTVGCVSSIVPKTVIKGNINGSPFSYSGPKDQSIKNLSISASTNGIVTITIEALDTKMNPDVITMSGKAQVEIINSISSAIQQAVVTGIKSAAK